MRDSGRYTRGTDFFRDISFVHLYSSSQPAKTSYGWSSSGPASRTSMKTHSPLMVHHAGLVLRMWVHRDRSADQKERWPLSPTRKCSIQPIIPEISPARSAQPSWSNT